MQVFFDNYIFILWTNLNHINTVLQAVRAIGVYASFCCKSEGYRLRMVNSRVKGSSFELSIGKLIYEHLGVTVRRDLDQYRESNHGDLIGLDGWTIECKRYADNSAFLHRPEWWTQTTNAAGDNTHPVLIYKFDRRPIRCVFPIHVINNDWTRKNNEVVTTSFETWCYVVREAQTLEIENK